MVTKEITVYYNGQYYKNMRVFALSLIPDNWIRDEEEWYLKIKAFLMKNYSKDQETIRIVDDNRLDNLLKDISNGKKNYIKFDLDKEKIIKECPFNWKANSKERKKKNSIKEIEENKENKEKKKENKEKKKESSTKENKEKKKKTRYYKDEKKIPCLTKTFSRIKRIKTENLFCKIYNMSESDMSKLSRETGIGMAVLNSLKYKVYKPSIKIEELITKGIEEMNIKKSLLRMEKK